MTGKEVSEGNKRKISKEALVYRRTDRSGSSLEVNVSVLWLLYITPLNMTYLFCVYERLQYLGGEARRKEATLKWGDNIKMDQNSIG